MRAHPYLLALAILAGSLAPGCGRSGLEETPEDAWTKPPDLSQLGGTKESMQGRVDSQAKPKQ